MADVGTCIAIDVGSDLYYDKVVDLYYDKVVHPVGWGSARCQVRLGRVARRPCGREGSRGGWVRESAARSQGWESPPPRSRAV